MKFKSSPSIKKKVLAMLVGTSLLLASILGLIIWNSLNRMMVDSLQTRGIEIGLHLAAISGDFMLTDDHYAIYQLLTQAMNGTEDIGYILVMNSDSHIIAHSFPNGIPKGLIKAQLPEGADSWQVKTLTSDIGNIIDVLVPVENGDLGFVRVGMTEKKAKEYILHQMLELIAATLGVCGTSAGFVYYGTWLITRPIEHLAVVASNISRGNILLRADIETNDEIGKLAQAFNEMADKLIAQSAMQEQLLTEKDGLLDELKEKERLRDSLITKLITAQEDERKRISRELHDETSQTLTSLIITLRVLADVCQDEYQKEVLYASRETTASILRDIRDLALELRPPLLDDMGLISALKLYVLQYEKKYPIKVSFLAVDHVPKLNTHTAIAFYRIVQEGLNNVAKHSKATKVQINLQVANDTLTLKLLDNGQGISEDDLIRARKDNRIGLYGIQERTELLGGTFIINSDKGGAELIIALPLHLDKDKEAI